MQSTSPAVTALSEYTLDHLPLLRRLRRETVSLTPHVCIERARLVTEFMRDLSSDSDPIQTRYAGAVAHFLSHKKPIFPDRNLLAGTTTSKRFGAPVYPEFAALTIWPELDTIGQRRQNPQRLDPADADELNSSIFPYWIDRTVLERTRKVFGNPKCLKLFESFVYYIAGKAGCLSHTVPDYSVVLDKGLEYIIDFAADAESRLRRKAGRTEEQNQSMLFYRSVGIALRGLCAYADNLHREALARKSTADTPEDIARFDTMASLCKRVPRKPARTFHEALCALWITQVGIHAENINMAVSPGRLDQLLYPWFRREYDDGALGPDEALTLVGCLWLKLNDNTNVVPESASELFGGAGTVPAVTLGGIDSEGNDAVNELTRVMLKVTGLLSLRDPNVCARYHFEKNDASYLHQVAGTIAGTRSTPSVFNDHAAIRVLEAQSVSTEDARNYAVIGCVELSTGGSSYDSSASIILNLATALEMTLYNGKRVPETGDQVGPATGDFQSFTSYEQFLDAFKTQLSFLIDSAVRLNEYMGEIHRTMLPSPLLSAVFTGPLESGRDLIHGGARYNSSGATHIGFADTVDSLCAIEYAVFSAKQCTPPELLAALKSDFDGNRPLHAYLVNKTPKFGADSPEARKNARMLIDFLYERYQSYRNYRGGLYRPAFWTMTNHAGLGRLCGALPSGRKAGKVFSSGITPSSQSARNLAESLHAVADLDARHIPGGFAFNLKYPSVETPDDVVRLGRTVDAFFRMGGLQIQFNVLSYEELIDAKNNPDKYPELLVRVSGYSAYFNDLNEAMKEELITRTEYELSSGAARIFTREHRRMLAVH